MAELAPPPPYPVRLEVDYPERQSRWKALLRLPLSIPLLLFSYLLQGSIVLAIWVTILVRGSIPRWLFDFQVAVNRWQARAAGHFLLLTDVCPPFDGGHTIRYDVAYPDRVSRWRVAVWKFITAIPHLVVLAVLWLSVLAVAVIAWFSILLTGRMPLGLHQYVAGVLRWGARVQAYVLSLTDEFPPLQSGLGCGACRPSLVHHRVDCGLAGGSSRDRALRDLAGRFRGRIATDRYTGLVRTVGRRRHPARRGNRGGALGALRVARRCRSRR